MGRRLPDTAFFATANGARLRPRAVSRQRLCAKSGKERNKETPLISSRTHSMMS